MNAKTIIGGVIAGVIAFLLGWLIFGTLMMNYYKENSVHYDGLMKDPMLYWAIGVANLAFGLLLAYIFNMGGVNSITRGLMVGFVVCVLMEGMFDSYDYAFMHLHSAKLLAIDVVLNGVLGALTGAVLGWWFSRK